MNKRKTRKINTTVSALLMLLYIITAVVDAVTAKNILIFSSVLCIGTLVGMYLILGKISTVYYLPAVTFAFFSMYLGTMLNFYDVIPCFDLILHSASGVLLVFVGHFVVMKLSESEKTSKIPLKIIVLSSTFISIAAAGLWEIWEFVSDIMLNRSSQLGSLTDTMTDIIAGTIGAIVGGVILHILLNNKTNKSE